MSRNMPMACPTPDLQTTLLPRSTPIPILASPTSFTSVLERSWALGFALHTVDGPKDRSATPVDPGPPVWGTGSLKFIAPGGKFSPPPGRRTGVKGGPGGPVGPPGEALRSFCPPTLSSMCKKFKISGGMPG